MMAYLPTPVNTAIMHLILIGGYRYKLSAEFNSTLGDKRAITYYYVYSEMVDGAWQDGMW
jgi:hypothetical protein